MEFPFSVGISLCIRINHTSHAICNLHFKLSISTSYCDEVYLFVSNIFEILGQTLSLNLFAAFFFPYILLMKYSLILSNKLRTGLSMSTLRTWLKACSKACHTLEWFESVTLTNILDVSHPSIHKFEETIVSISPIKLWTLKKKTYHKNS